MNIALQLNDNVVKERKDHLFFCVILFAVFVQIKVFGIGKSLCTQIESSDINLDLTIDTINISLLMNSKSLTVVNRLPAKFHQKLYQQMTLQLKK